MKKVRDDASSVVTKLTTRSQRHQQMCRGKHL